MVGDLLKKYCETANRRCSILDDKCPFQGDMIRVILHITDNCNENCSFCWHKESKKNMNMKKEQIDSLFNFLQKDYKGLYPVIGLVGGEPTLDLELVQYVIQRCKTNFKRYVVSLTTNAVIMPSNEFIHYYAENNGVLNISLPRRESDKFNIRKKNIEQYSKLSDMINLKFLLTINNKEIDKLEEILEDWDGLIPDNKFELIVSYQDHQDKEYEMEEYNNRIDKLIKLNNMRRKFRIIRFTPSKTESLLDSIKRSNQVRSFVYNLDGNIYLTVRDKYYNNDPIGTLEKGIDTNKVISLLESIPCCECKYSGLCKANSSNFIFRNKIHKNDQCCDYYKRIIDHYNLLKREE